jgi:disulfide oxidoreductase YuzD
MVGIFLTKTVEIVVYGAEQVCPSCVRLPSSKETASWIESALLRRYGKQIQVRYIDIFAPESEHDQVWAQRILEEDLWYPIVVIKEEMIAEGNPKLKSIYEKIEALGVVAL